MISKTENGGRFTEYFRKAKETGKMKITACSMASRLFGLNKEDFTDVVDGIGGLTSFLDSSEGSNMMSIW
jgi:peroxiredoxin family protein